MKKIPIGATIREIFLDTGGVHYLWLGLLTTYEILKGGEHMEIAILVLVCILTALGLIASTIWLLGVIKSKSKRAQLKGDLDEVEHAIKDVKDDIDSADTALNSCSDEGVRKMLRFTKEQHVSKLNQLTAKRDNLKLQLGK